MARQFEYAGKGREHDQDFSLFLTLSYHMPSEYLEYITWTTFMVYFRLPLSYVPISLSQPFLHWPCRQLIMQTPEVLSSALSRTPATVTATVRRWMDVKR